MPEFVSISEANGSAEVCVDPGITGKINATLSITLQINNGTAGEML